MKAITIPKTEDEKGRCWNCLNKSLKEKPHGCGVHTAIKIGSGTLEPLTMDSREITGIQTLRDNTCLILLP